MLFYWFNQGNFDKKSKTLVTRLFDRSFSEPHPYPSVLQGYSLVQFQPGVMKQLNAAAEHRHLPSRAFRSKHPTELSVQVSEILVSLCPHTVWWIRNHPSRTGRWLNGGDRPACEFDAIPHTGSLSIRVGRPDRAGITVGCNDSWKNRWVN